jgi:Ni/Co efflux regulator RcnB
MQHHAEQRDQWRGEHRDWRARAVWERNHDWWRGNPAFRDYRGPREHAYFAPGYGYYEVPEEYWGRRWEVGALLPFFFLRYAVPDYEVYGLPPPPPGCEWVWVGNSVLLVDESDGYVLDEVDDVW